MRWSIARCAGAVMGALLGAVPVVGVAATPSSAGAVLSVPEAGAVRIVRDEYGVPHIYASSERALFYGEGYAVGQDRLWQAELLRRTGTGTIAQVPRVGGPSSVPDDLYFRTYTGGAAHLRELFAQLPAPARTAVQAFSDGINAWIRTATKRHALPPEYKTIGLTPRPWSPEDVIATWFVVEQQYGSFGV